VWLAQSSTRNQKQKQKKKLKQTNASKSGPSLKSKRSCGPCNIAGDGATS